MMNRFKKSLAAAAAVAMLAILPATAFAAGGHHGHKAKAHLYWGSVATATASMPLLVAVKGNDMSFNLLPKTRYFVDGQRQSSEPSFTAGERVRVRARDLKTGGLTALVIRARTK